MSKFVYGIFYALSLLPMFVLHGIGDIFFLILYYVIGYRKEVVLKNLNIAFPEKTDAERKKIMRKCYRNFMHTWVETIKFITISKKQADGMVTGDYSLFKKLHENQHPRITLIGGHFMNWELLNFSIPIHQPYNFLAVYMHITNAPINDLFLKIRTRFGGQMLRAGEMRTAMIPWRNKEYALALGADQNPGSPTNAVWLNFFGKPTAFVTGPEKNAKAGNTPVVMCWLEKQGVGKYTIHFELLVEDPKSELPHEITRKYVRKLETLIKASPDLYLWTHKRWKHEWKDEYKSLWIDTTPPPQA